MTVMTGRRERERESDLFGRDRAGRRQHHSLAAGLFIHRSHLGALSFLLVLVVVFAFAYCARAELISLGCQPEEEEEEAGRRVEPGSAFSQALGGQRASGAQLSSYQHRRPQACSINQAHCLWWRPAGRWRCDMHASLADGDGPREASRRLTSDLYRVMKLDTTTKCCKFSAGNRRPGHHYLIAQI